MTEQERRAYLDWMLANLPDVPSWRQWQQTTGELPPDFDALPRHNLLPDPLQFLDGKMVKSPAEWPARRAEILQLFEKYDIGTVPPKPKLDNVTVDSETTLNGITTRVVILQYGPGEKTNLRVTLTIPEGTGPFPVLIGGSAAAVQRGYINCTFSGSVDQLSNLPQLYPQFDFASMGQRAFNAQMVVDYLYTLPQVDQKHIAITGYSREGKMATIAAALDERIAAVVAGSTGVGGVLSWRQGSERNQAESIQSTTLMFPLWFVPRLRFFAGHEDRLPIDGNLLVALVAPRACLIEYGSNDEVSNIWGSEQTLRSVQPLYKMLGNPEGVGIMRVVGVHGANNEEVYLNWLDIQFGRSPEKWANNLMFPWDYSQWLQHSGFKIDLSKYPAHKVDDLLVDADGKPITTTAAWEAKAAEIRKNINFMLGDKTPVVESVPMAAPANDFPAGRGRGGPPPAGGARGGPGGAIPAIPANGGPGGARGGRGGPAGFGGASSAAMNIGTSPTTLTQNKVAQASAEFGWLAPQREQIKTRVIAFGDNLKGDIYYPANTPEGTPLPTIIWLHGYSYPLGYMWVYKRDLHPILALTQAGYAVFAYDQSGFGSRANESAPFYERYPQWSHMGRLVEDARAAIDALQKDALVAPQSISIFGYTLGGMVGLYTAALDIRVHGVVSVSGFTPMRTDTVDRGTGGIARYFDERGLLPRLGAFSGHEAQLPYDFDDVLGAIAPRPALIIAPTRDRDATPADVHAAVIEARKVYALYNKAANLGLYEPVDYIRLPAVTEDWLIHWMDETINPFGKKSAPAATLPTIDPPVAVTGAK